jgi:hypothetical protein
MAHLSPRKPRQAMAMHNVKSAHVEIYPIANFEFKGQVFETGFVFVIIGSKLLASRRDVPGDKTLRFLSGLCANDLSKHPAWEEALNRALPQGTQLAYLNPNHPANCSRWQCGDDIAPGAWVLQGAATTMTILLELLGTTFTHALLADGWEPLLANKALQRQVTLPSGSWCEQMQIILAPRGSFTAASANLLASFAARHSWLQTDGSLAHAEAGGNTAALPFALSNPEEAEAALATRSLCRRASQRLLTLRYPCNRRLLSNQPCLRPPPLQILCRTYPTLLQPPSRSMLCLCRHLL